MDSSDQVAAASVKNLVLYVVIGAVAGLVVLVPCILLLSAGKSAPTVAVAPAPEKNLPSSGVAPAPITPVVVAPQPSPAATVAPGRTPVVQTPPPPPPPQPQPAGKATPVEDTINLMNRCEPPTNTLQGKVTRQGEMLVTQGNKPDIISAEVEIPADYVLDLVVCPRTRAESLHVGLVVGGVPTVFLVDAFVGTRTGLFMINGRGMLDPSFPGHKGSLLKIDQPTKVRIAVTPRSVIAWCDDHQVFAWQGDPRELNWAIPYPPPTRPCLFVGSWDCRFEISQWQLTPGKK
jgi:hypothetical protein